MTCSDSVHPTTPTLFKVFGKGTYTGSPVQYSRHRRFGTSSGRCCWYLARIHYHQLQRRKWNGKSANLRYPAKKICQLNVDTYSKFDLWCSKISFQKHPEKDSSVSKWDPEVLDGTWIVTVNISHLGYCAKEYFIFYSFNKMDVLVWYGYA